MADDEARGRKLQVANSRPEESGHGLAHVPRAVMAALGLQEGDAVEILGKRVTPARAVPPYPEDEGLEILRIDGLQRANAGIGSGDFVEIRKAKSKAATRVVFAPAQDNIRLQGSAGALKRTFAGRPLCEGDTVATAGHQRVNAAVARKLLETVDRRGIAVPADAIAFEAFTVSSTFFSC